MTEREKAVRRMAEAAGLPAVPEVLEAGGWCAPPAAIYDPVPGFDWPVIGVLRGGPEPLHFPGPPTLDAADRIEATAAQLLETFPYRTLLACRELAARLVDEVLTWDAMWPEAEGDYPFCCEYCHHNHAQLCDCQPCRFIAEIGFQHADDCAWVAMQ